MGEASMRKWMRRARRILVECRLCRRPLRRSLNKDAVECPTHGEAWTGLEFVQAQGPAPTRSRALVMRREHRDSRMRARLRRSLAKATEIMRRAFASSIASMVSPNNALLRRLSLHA